MTFRRLFAFATLALTAACASGGSTSESPNAGPPGAPPTGSGSAAGGDVERAVPAQLRAGERVQDIRSVRRPIEVTVGDRVSLQDLELTPVDADGVPVPEAQLLMAPLEGPVAVLDGGSVVGREEGDAELLLAVMVPGRGGNAEPRIFPMPIVVRGARVASVTVLPPQGRLYAGTSVPFGFEARTAQGVVRTRVEVGWSSRNPEIASVSQGGFVRGNRPGRATIVATVEGVQVAHVVEVLENPVATLDLSPATGSVRTGDVIRFSAVARSVAGSAVSDVAITYAVAGTVAGGSAGAAAIYPDGAFVAEVPGTYRVVVSAGLVSAEAIVDVRPRDAAERAVRVGVGLTSSVPSSDLWVFRGLDGRDYAYVGTHEGGQKMFVWDVTTPASPVLTDSVVVDARVVNDVKVNAAGTLAVITREGASDRRNGIVLLDTSTPAHPQVITTYTQNLTGGVHNTFISGDLVYAINDGTLDVHIIDVSTPAAPREVGRWGIDTPGKYLHDIWVVDGIGYVSYWDDGVYILDLGGGGRGGTPTQPVVMSSYKYPEGHTHVAFPYRNSNGNSYLFVGDEIFDCEECVARAGSHERGPRGYVHVLSMANPSRPVEVARYEVPEAGVHNLWVEDDRLYAAYYQGGLRVLDVSGELRGDLYAQGREIAWFPTGHPDGYTPNSPMAWGPQPYRGNVFVSDRHSGLWVVRVEPRPSGPLLP